jgi:N-acetylmuramidase-like protein
MLMRGHREAALASASWGAFQIMGFNHRACGFATASDFAQSLSLSASNQLSAFLEFCKAKGAHTYLATKDWAGFASHYNGPDYRVNHYDRNLAAAYQRFSSGA